MTPKINRIGSIGNYYGGLSVKEENGKFFWSIENYSGHDWEEIPESLYLKLMEFENENPDHPSP